MSSCSKSDIRDPTDSVYGLLFFLCKGHTFLFFVYHFFVKARRFRKYNVVTLGIRCPLSSELTIVDLQYCVSVRCTASDSFPLCYYKIWNIVPCALQ